MQDRSASNGATSHDLIETRLRVVTWNTWWRYGPWERRRPLLESTLRALDADVIALQEVWDDGTANLAVELGAALGRTPVYRESERREGLGFGNAILSRWPVARSDWRRLPGQEESGEGRAVLFAELEGPRGPIQVFTAHLDWKLHHSHIRQQQVSEIARFVDAEGPSDFPPILCGDFNADPMSEEIRMLTGFTTCPVEGVVFSDAWRVAGVGSAGFTWDNENEFTRLDFEPDRRIDYIFVGMAGAGGAGHVVDCRLAGDAPVDGIWPSDHIAVVAELRY